VGKQRRAYSGGKEFPLRIQKVKKPNSLAMAKDQAMLSIKCPPLDGCEEY
jgi:hypothetical protein